MRLVVATVSLAWVCVGCGDHAAPPVAEQIAPSAGGEVAQAPAARVEAAQRRAEGSEVERALAIAKSDARRAARLLHAAARLEERVGAAWAGHEREALEAQRAYAAIIEDHPSSELVAEALFRSARLFMGSRQAAESRRRYLLLIQRFPRSELVPFAFLSFGEYFMEQADYASARQFYDRVEDGERPEDLVGYVRYQLARAYVGEGDCQHAVEYLRRVTSAPSGVAEDVMRAAQSESAALSGCANGAGQLRPAEAVAPPPPVRTAEALEALLGQ
jgi:tetratricopeptide (TPR) repeat protein